MLRKYFPDVVNDLMVTIFHNDEFVNGVSIIMEEGVNRDGELLYSITGGDNDADITVRGE